MNRFQVWFIMNLFLSITLVLGLYQNIDILLIIALSLIWWCGLNALILLAAILVIGYIPQKPPVNRYVDFSYDIFIIFLLSAHGYLITAFMQTAILLYCQIACTYHQVEIK